VPSFGKCIISIRTCIILSKCHILVLSFGFMQFSLVLNCIFYFFFFSDTIITTKWNPPTNFKQTLWLPLLRPRLIFCPFWWERLRSRSKNILLTLDPSWSSNILICTWVTFGTLEHSRVTGPGLRSLMYATFKVCRCTTKPIMLSSEE
jgi:hypothetical protein